MARLYRSGVVVGLPPWRVKSVMHTSLGSRQESGRDLRREGLPPNGIRYLSDPRRAVVHGIAAFELWDLHVGRIEKKLAFPSGVRSTSAWTVLTGSDRLVVGVDDGTLRVLDLEANDIIACTLPPDAEAFLRRETPGLGSFTSVIHPDGSQEDQSRFYTPYTRSCSLSSSADGERVIAAYGQAYAVLWDLETGEMRHLIGSWTGQHDLDRIYRVALSPDGRLAATVHMRSGLHIWETGNARHLLHLPLSARRVGSSDRPIDMPVGTVGFDGIGPVVFSPDSRTVAAADGAQVRLWDVATGRDLVPWQGFGCNHPILGEYDRMPRIHDIRFSGDGSRVLTIGVDATLRVRKVETGEQFYGAIGSV
jgi:WD40 repeat protein